MAYHVIEVGCIECAGGGDSGPEHIESHEAFQGAVSAVIEWRDEYRYGDADRFIVDGATGRVHRPTRAPADPKDEQ